MLLLEWNKGTLNQWFGNYHGALRGHWEKFTDKGIRIKSPFDAVYSLEARKWFVENNYILIECTKCIQV